MMRCTLLLVVALLGLHLPCRAEESESRFFPVKGTEFGVYYYPEHWPEDQWERDIKHIAELGFQFIHCAEFAWQRLEPAEGQYDFTWLDRVVDMADKNGLKVVMCTPSPCPPAWLPTKYPEVLAVNESGKRLVHNGGRLSGSLANPIYQKYVAAIATQMAQHYGQDKRIIGWQIGNEPHISSGCDYSPSAKEAYIRWLHKKYPTIEAVNQSWGGPFWSYSLSSFDEIQIPGSNPHAELDFQMYTSDEIARDLIDQAKVLRKFTRKDQWITTNYAYYKGLKNVNPFLTKNDLDFASHTMYLTSNRSNTTGDSLAHRLGSGMEHCFSQEVAASVNGYSGIMELQPGQINWGKFNAMPLPGAVRMWVWHSFGLGERFVCTYRYRQPLYGMEQFHHGIMQTDGVTESLGGQDFVKAIKEVRDLSKQLQPSNRNIFVDKSRTAFLWSQRNIIDVEGYKHHQDWDTWQHIYTYYQALKRMGVKVDFVQESDAFSPVTHPFMVVPAYQMMSLELVAKLENYVKQGGHLIMSTRSCLKDSNGHMWEMKIQQPIWNLVGGEIEFYDHLPANGPGNVRFGETAHSWHTWGTVIKPSPDTQSWSLFEDQFYKGKSAITHHKMGKGTSTYVGLWSDKWDLEYQVLRRVYGESVGDLPFDLPPYVFAHYREGLWVAVNYTDKPTPIPVPKDSRILLGSKVLQPGEVLVWQD